MKEKTIYRICLPMMAAAAIFTVTVAIHDRSENSAVYAAPVELVDNFTAETVKAPGKADFDAQSAMPCVDRESFRRFLETYEPETGEESIQKAHRTQSGFSETDRESREGVCEPARSDRVDSEIRGEADHSGDLGECGGITSRDSNESGSEARLYLIDGKMIDPEIQRTLWEHLNAAGIGYWYTGALAQMMQESGGDPTIVNPTNGIDMGLYQYREPFWDYSRGDIFDPEAQIRLYVEETAARINAGLTVDEVISRHFTSDYVTEIDWEYVRAVRQHLATMEVIE